MDQSGRSGRQCASGILCGWGVGLGPFFPPAATPFYRLTLYIPPFPSFFLVSSYSYVPLIPFRLKSVSTRGLSLEAFSASRYLSETLASQRLSPNILTLYGIRLKLDG